MPGCILRVSAKDFDVDAFLSVTTFKPYRVDHQGQAYGRRGKIYQNSGFCVDVSRHEELKQQIPDAIQFLKENQAELQRVSEVFSKIFLTLDFGHCARDVAAQFDYLPPELLLLAGSLNIGIEISLYHNMANI
jgi:hypothetical protein